MYLNHFKNSKFWGPYLTNIIYNSFIWGENNDVILPTAFVCIVYNELNNDNI